MTCRYIAYGINESMSSYFWLICKYEGIIMRFLSVYIQPLSNIVPVYIPFCFHRRLPFRSLQIKILVADGSKYAGWRVQKTIEELQDVRVPWSSEQPMVSVAIEWWKILSVMNLILITWGKGGVYFCFCLIAGAVPPHPHHPHNEFF